MGKRLERLGDDLSLYVRQFAWLTATPRRKDSQGREEKLARRIDQFKADEIEPPLPAVDPEPFWTWLFEAGPTEAAGMGDAPISWQAIDAWMGRTATSLTPWDVRMLRRMSRDYHAESHAAEDWARPAPWIHEPTKVQRAAEDRQLREAFGIG